MRHLLLAVSLAVLLPAAAAAQASVPDTAAILTKEEVRARLEAAVQRLERACASARAPGDLAWHACAQREMGGARLGRVRLPRVIVDGVEWPWTDSLAAILAAIPPEAADSVHVVKRVDDGPGGAQAGPPPEIHLFMREPARWTPPPAGPEAVRFRLVGRSPGMRLSPASPGDAAWLRELVGKAPGITPVAPDTIARNPGHLQVRDCPPPSRPDPRLWVIDGVLLRSGSPGPTPPLQPEEIVRVERLGARAAAKRYGPDGALGAVLITATRASGVPPAVATDPCDAAPRPRHASP